MSRQSRGALALAVLALAAPAYAQNGDPNAGRNAFKEGLLVTGTSAEGAFSGTFVIERFEAIGGQVIAVGRLSGAAGSKSFSNLAVALPVDTAHGKGGVPGGGRTGSLEPRKGGALTLPAAYAPAVPNGRSPARGNPLVQPAQATCDVLALTLGPLHLDLLGLVVDLDPVVLNVTAQQAPGNLLGNLLCAATNLLNGFNPNLAAQLAGLLNQVAAILAAL